jgi:hypothetical protein
VLGTIAPYLMSFSAMAFAAVSALTLIHFVSHLDPPDVDAPSEPIAPRIEFPEKIAV